VKAHGSAVAGDMKSDSVPAIVLGGAANALSAARNLARHGIEVVAVNYPDEAIRLSRYARYVRLDDSSSPEDWKKFLLGSESDYLRGSVLLACSDEAISIIVDNYAPLSDRFLLEESDPAIRRELLDKFIICQRAQQAGIPTVGYWLVRSTDDVARLMPDLPFPLVMKPLYSPNSDLLKGKAIVIRDRGDLLERLTVAQSLQVPVMLMEYIPGGDDQLCSYYTYLDEFGTPLVHFTKRLKRRYPRGSGEGTYHVSTWIPEAAELGLQFFRSINFRGLGNIEFKRDGRDGKLKIIEVNARFTASDCLIAKSGVNLPLLTYKRLTGQQSRAALHYDKSLVLCRPIKDAFAAWDLWKTGELDFLSWLGDLWRINQFPFFEWRDPMPALFACRQRTRRLATKLLSAARPGKARLTKVQPNPSDPELATAGGRYVSPSHLPTGRTRIRG
jgi:D-aspartate ligase